MKKAMLLLSCVILASAWLGSAEIVVTSPAAGASWCQGTEQQIIWTATGRMDDNAKINLRAGSRVVLSITDSISTTAGRCNWLVPTTLAPGTYYIRVRTRDDVVHGDSAAFTVCLPTLVSRVAPTAVMTPMATTKTFTMPVTFRSEKVVWYRFTDLGPLEVFCPRDRIKNPIGDVPATEMLVGYYNQWIHNDVCPNECYNLYYRSSPLWDVARLSTLIGKTIAKATLILNHKVTIHDPICGSCPDCLHKVFFYEGLMGDMNATPHESRTLSVGTASTVNIDVTDMMSNWLREKDPSYHGERHNYHMLFGGPNEEHNCNNQKCLTWYQNASLEIKYRE